MKCRILSRMDALLDSQRQGHHIPPAKEGEGEECTCLCCGTVFHGNYCPQCGQSSSTRRLRLSDMVSHMVSSLTNLDGQLLHTLHDLFTRPGYMIWDFICGRRAEYFKPVQMLFFLATVYLLVDMVVDIDTDAAIVADIDREMANEKTAEIVQFLQWGKDLVEWIHDNKALSALLSNLLLLLPMKWAFRKTERGREMNLTEYFYALAFVGCLQLIIAMAVMPWGKVLDMDLSDTHSIMTMLIYIWIFHQLFEISWRRSIRRGLVVVMLLMLEIFTMVFVLGIIVGVAREMGLMHVSG